MCGLLYELFWLPHFVAVPYLGFSDPAFNLSFIEALPSLTSRLLLDNDGFSQPLLMPPSTPPQLLLDKREGLSKLHSGFSPGRVSGHLASCIIKNKKSFYDDGQGIGGLFSQVQT